MNNTNEPVGSTPGMSTLERARFGPGMLLQHEDLEQLNTYTRELSRLLFQSFFGCGVICGLVVEAVPECDKLKVSVRPGVALSCSGDPVYVPGPKPTDVFTKPSFNLTPARELWVVLCATTKCCAPRTTTCCSDDDEATSDCTREKDGFEIRLLTERPNCACACPIGDANTLAATTHQNNDNESECKCVTDFTCHEAHYAGICGCTCGECSGCDCKCILLARLEPDAAGKAWKADHSVRRFIRPVLMRDPKVEIEVKERAEQQQQPQPKSQQIPQPQGQALVHRLDEVRQERLRLQAEERRLQREQKQQEAAVAATGKGTPT
ncbi:MAG TPA: hypothetical protein VGC66_03595 [Pyrinomonadaceae bacterium]|jgi:hypothetical protein